MKVLAKVMMVIILQCINISDEHLKLMLSVNYTSVKLEKNKVITKYQIKRKK